MRIIIITPFVLYKNINHKSKKTAQEPRFSFYTKFEFRRSGAIPKSAAAALGIRLRLWRWRAEDDEDADEDDDGGGGGDDDVVPSSLFRLPAELLPGLSWLLGTAAWSSRGAA